MRSDRGGGDRMNKLTEEFESFIDIGIAAYGACVVLCEESVATEYLNKNKNISAIGRLSVIHFIGRDILTSVRVNIIQPSIKIESNMMTYEFIRKEWIDYIESSIQKDRKGGINKWKTMKKTKFMS